MWYRASWVSGLEFGNSHLTFPGSLHVEFHLLTGKQGNLSKVLLGNRYVHHWDEIEDSKFLEKYI